MRAIIRVSAPSANRVNASPCCTSGNALLSWCMLCTGCWDPLKDQAQIELAGIGRFTGLMSAANGADPNKAVAKPTACGKTQIIVRLRSAACQKKNETSQCRSALHWDTSARHKAAACQQKGTRHNTVRTSHVWVAPCSYMGGTVLTTEVLHNPPGTQDRPAQGS
jgi:hypothetical protein